MKFSTFDLAIDALRIIAENEERARDAGIEIQALTDPMINALMAVVDECYAGYHGEDIGYFCWELDFGRKWEPGRMVDSFGRDVKLSNVRELYDHLEHNKPFKTEWNYPKDGCMIGHGRRDGVDYYLYWHSTWWCAYIDVRGTRFDGTDYDNIDIDCHGGFTYSEPTLPSDFKGYEQSWYIGWDYAHAGDEDITFYDFSKIEEDVWKVIDELKISHQ